MGDLERKSFQDTDLRERSITLNITDCEADKLLEISRSCGVSIEELLEDFIGNITNGFHKMELHKAMLAKNYIMGAYNFYANADSLSFASWLQRKGLFKEVEEIISKEDSQEEEISKYYSLYLKAFRNPIKAKAKEDLEAEEVKNVKALIAYKEQFLNL